MRDRERERERERESGGRLHCFIQSQKARKAVNTATKALPFHALLE